MTNHITVYVDILHDTYGRNASPYSYAAYDSVAAGDRYTADRIRGDR